MIGDKLLELYVKELLTEITPEALLQTKIAEAEQLLKSIQSELAPIEGFQEKQMAGWVQ